MDIAFCRSLPKLELHAHLNGSLSQKTLENLHTNQSSIEDFLKLNRVLNLGPSRTLAECFELFKIAHNATNTQESVYKATVDVITEFHSDGVIYLELRTTPRKEPNMSKQEYIDSVIKGVKKCQLTLPNIIVKLILSLNRKQTFDDASETVDIILKYSEQYPAIIKGIDVSGDPIIGNWFSPLMSKVRCESDLGITIHCAEVENVEETEKILDFKPNRIGHGTYIWSKNREKLWRKLHELKIPVECCLTSNIKCKTVSNYSDHHVGQLIQSKHPFTLGTDDKGVFSTTLSEEYKITADTFGLTKEDLWTISYNTIEFSFCSQEEKNQLKAILNEWKKLHQF